jgi:hypothetical protein
METPSTALKLTTKQTRFVAEYLIHGNGSRAARAAGWREIARICGFYVPEKPLQVSVNIAAKRTIQMLETLPDEELMRMAEGREQGS